MRFFSTSPGCRFSTNLLPSSFCLFSDANLSLVTELEANRSMLQPINVVLSDINASISCLVICTEVKELCPGVESEDPFSVSRMLSAQIIQCKQKFLDSI